jgi:hypothetical protein
MTEVLVVIMLVVAVPLALWLLMYLAGVVIIVIEKIRGRPLFDDVPGEANGEGEGHLSEVDRGETGSTAPGRLLHAGIELDELERRIAPLPHAVESRHSFEYRTGPEEPYRYGIVVEQLVWWAIEGTAVVDVRLDNVVGRFRWRSLPIADADAWEAIVARMSSELGPPAVASTGHPTKHWIWEYDDGVTREAYWLQHWSTEEWSLEYREELPDPDHDQ